MKIPSTIANAATRTERAAGQQRLQICIAAGFATQLPRGSEVLIRVGSQSCRARIERRRDNGAAVLTDAVAAGPGDVDLATILAEIGLGIGDHPALELAGKEEIRLVAAGPDWTGL